MSDQPTTEEKLSDAYQEIVKLQEQLADAQHALLRTQNELARNMRIESHRTLTTARTWPDALYRYQLLMQQYVNGPIGCPANWFDDQATIAETAALELSRALDNEKLDHAQAQVIDLRAKAIDQTAQKMELRSPGNAISHAMRLIPEGEDQLSAWLTKLVFI